MSIKSIDLIEPTLNESVVEGGFIGSPDVLSKTNSNKVLKAVLSYY